MKDFESQPWRNQMVWGAVVVVAGVALLLDRTGALELGHLWHYWPLLLGVAGVSNFVPPTTPKLILSGMTSVGMAAWFFVSLEHVWGLSFHNSWPMLLILWGLEVALKPVLYKHFDSKE